MSRLKVNLPGNEIPINGKQVSFRAPCDCSDITCIVIDGEDYALVDSSNGIIAGTVNRWVAGALISVMLDVDNKKAYILNASPCTTCTAVLKATSWSSYAPYTQTVEVPGLLATDEPFIDVYLSGVESVEDGQAILDSWLYVGRAAVTADGTLVAYCYEDKPYADIPIILKAVR